MKNNMDQRSRSLSIFLPSGILKRFSKIIIISLVLCFFIVSSGYAAGRDITLQWDESIDAPYLQSYKIYYYTISGNPGSLSAADYAVSYTLAGGSPIFLNPLSDPKPITIPKSNTRITLHFSDSSKNYFFVATAVDTRGLESVPTPEIGTAISAQEYVLLTLNPGPGKGTVSGSGINCGDTCLAACNSGAVVSLSATADPGSTFAGWSGEGCLGTGLCTVIMNANKTITANFQMSIVINYSITASVSGAGGTISPSGASSVSSGGSRTYSITPATGYSIDSILVDGIAIGAVTSYTFSSVTANHTIVAAFKAMPAGYSITASVSGTGGTISPSGTISVSFGEIKKFTITPQTGYRIVNVIADGISRGSITEYTFWYVTSNRSITATFAVK